MLKEKMIRERQHTGEDWSDPFYRETICIFKYTHDSDFEMAVATHGYSASHVKVLRDQPIVKEFA
jgi:hypothetical protein